MQHQIVSRAPRAPRRGRACLALLGLTVAALGTVRADTLYKIQSIARSGDRVGETRIGSYLAPGTLNDEGQIIFVAQDQAGGEILAQYRDGTLVPIVVGGGDAPGGKWPKGGVNIAWPVSMNERGNAVFAPWPRSMARRATASFAGTTTPGRSLRWR